VRLPARYRPSVAVDSLAASVGNGNKPGPRERAAARTGITALTLGALGVVFGDIGTSPLYALQAVFTTDHHAVHAVQAEVYGVISLVFWSVTMVVSVKYVATVMRADDHGQGGIIALTALLQAVKKSRSAIVPVALITLGIVGAALFYGDGAITPAISVLSAVEGLKIAIPGLSSLVLPIAVAVLCVLFAIQRFGTGVVGKLFGPVMVVWFSVLGLAGAIEVAHHPGVLRALLPSYAVQFFGEHGGVAFIALASVVLVVTGAEALYADMGHFGRPPIRRAWFLIVFPALTLNYLGQAALIVRRPDVVSNPFFLLMPQWGRIPMVFLATAATIIASQAVISGAFSVTQQAVQLGFLPRFAIRHTSEQHAGQIYAPAINAGLFATVLTIAIGFGSATALASAYGVAVTGTFILDTILFLAVARLLWKKPRRLVVFGAAVFLTVDLAFFTANLTKVAHGGWLPLTIALIVFVLVSTWSLGRERTNANRVAAEGLLADFIEQLRGPNLGVRQVPGVAVFLSPNLQGTPLALQANVEHNEVLHDHVIIVAVETQRAPRVARSDRVALGRKIIFSGATGEPLGPLAESITPLTVRFGFLEEHDVPDALRIAAEQGLLDGEPDLEQATYFVSNIAIAPNDAPGMASWRKRLFAAMARNAADPADYFRLPDDRTVTTSGRIPL
jgi:KUP system potassium uptake protein